MLIESMRDIGYSLETALADIIDNSITAKARSIRLLADTTSAQPSLAILDDGEGMSEDELLAAIGRVAGTRSKPGTRRISVALGLV
ncbi:MAG: ATP-binding protein [Acetobacteraceae bacterium]|nr:ATP-binding protein [Novosphingobium sp.]MBX9701126.1 ATP-binding protein [Acetobacteraceae bacterium]